MFKVSRILSHQAGVLLFRLIIDQVAESQGYIKIDNDK
jgi:hypothetical protein